MIYNGSNQIAGVKLGSNDISGIYVGENKMWPARAMTGISFSQWSWKVGKSEFLSYKGETVDINSFNYQVVALYSDGTREDITSAATYSGSYTVGASTVYYTQYNIQYQYFTASYKGFSTQRGTWLSQEGLPCVRFSNVSSNYMDIYFTVSNILEYSWDAVNWYNITTSTNFGPAPNYDVYVRGKSTTYSLLTGKFNISGEGGCEVSGNIMGLLGQPYWETRVSDYAFDGLFSYVHAIRSVSEDFFRYMTTTGRYCCQNMFNNCVYLMYGPRYLPATDAAAYCYNQMFYNCYRLTNMPHISAVGASDYAMYNMFNSCDGFKGDFSSYTLPATFVGNYAYAYMFTWCRFINKAPYIKAVNLGTGAFEGMFDSCYALHEIRCDAIDSTQSANWVINVPGTGDFYGKAAAGWSTGTSGIPNGWNQHLD